MQIKSDFNSERFQPKFQRKITREKNNQRRFEQIITDASMDALKTNIDDYQTIVARIPTKRKLK